MRNAYNRARGVLAGLLVLSGCGAGDEVATGESVEAAGSALDAAAVQVEYLAHASFLIRSPEGIELLVDPYASRVWLGYDFPRGIDPNAILITHPHYDHDAGRYRKMPFPWGEEVPVVDAPGTYTFGDIIVTGVEGKHADPYGKEFGQLNTLMVIEVAGLRFMHVGDNGPLSPEALSQLGRIDILFLPADGLDHILSMEETAAIRDAIRPRVLVPMHYRIADLETSADSPSDLGEIGPWLSREASVTELGRSIYEFSVDALPAEPSVFVFEHSDRVVAALR